LFDNLNIMDSTNLTRSQAKKVNAALFPKLNYLYCLRERMHKVGFPPCDPLYLVVEKAYCARPNCGRSCCRINGVSILGLRTGVCRIVENFGEEVAGRILAAVVANLRL
jgi:hypothetical protein